MIIVIINDYKFLYKMKTVGERLTYLIESQFVTKAEFYKKYDLKDSSWNPITTNKRTLGILLLDRLVEIFPNLNVNWLLYGKGNVNISTNALDESLMIVSEPRNNEYDDPVEVVFMKYLERQNVRKTLKKIIEETIDEKK